MRLHNKLFKWLAIIFLVWCTFFITDYILASYNKAPIFCIPLQVYRDGGTTEYYGFGYKVIKYRRIDNKRTDCDFGDWGLEYSLKIDMNDFISESIENDKFCKISEIPDTYTVNMAKNDGCIVIENSKIDGKEILDKFFENSSIEEDDHIRVVDYTDVEYPMFIDFVNKRGYITYVIGRNDSKTHRFYSSIQYDLIIIENRLTKIYTLINPHFGDYSPICLFGYNEEDL